MPLNNPSIVDFRFSIFLTNAKEVYDKKWKMTKKYQHGNQNMGFMGQIGPNMGQNMGFMDFMGRVDTLILAKLIR